MCRFSRGPILHTNLKPVGHIAHELKAVGHIAHELKAVGHIARELKDKNNLQLLAMDVSGLVSMKNAANCDKQCDLQTSKNH